MEQDVLKNFQIEDILTPEAKGAYHQIADAFQKAQMYIAALQGKESLSDLDQIKVGTTLTFGILTILSGGKSVKNFTRDDWAETFQYVGEHVLLKDDRDYNRYIFDLYAKYIDFSAIQLAGHVSDAKVQAIHALAEALREKEQALLDENISEVDYIEDCLWICLEAMIKMLAAIPALLIKSELLENFTDAVAMFGLQYGRLMLYRKELALLDEYLMKQKQLDENLRLRLEAYLQQVKEKQRMFDELVQNAFEGDSLEQHLASVRLARAMGVEEEEILETEEDIDDFFLD